jgi:urea transport system permease protein
MPIVWVAFSGRGDITATLVGSFLILFAFQTITVHSQQAALVLMGGMLLATVMIAPQGFVIGIARTIGRVFRGRSAGNASSSNTGS